jgi:long-chain acyl-CoA synthetase
MGLHNQIVLGDLLRRNAKLFPHKVGIIDYDTGDQFTFSDFDKRVNRVANGLLGLGLKKGDRVGVMQVNSHQFLEIMHACFKTGMVITPVNLRLAGPEISYILNNAGASALIYGMPFKPLVDSFRGELESVKYFICVGSEAADGKSMPYKDFYQSSDADVNIEVFDDDLALLPYTAGTTGRPKGVMLTHKNQIAQITECVIDTRCIPRSETFLCVAPLFHIAVWMYLGNFYCHGTTVTMSKFDPKLVMQAIQDLKVNVMFMAPAMIIMMLEVEGIEKFDLSSLRQIPYGGSSIPPDRLKKAMDAFKCEFGQGYGMTEVSPFLLTWFSPEDHVIALKEKPNRLTSCGRPGFNAMLRVVNDKDEDVGVNEAGEVLIRGQHVMKGYWKNPEADEQALKGGWFHTGDIAKVDEDGYYYIVDRKKDMYISGGENVYPKEVEDILFSHPAIFEAAVIGVPDPKWGEVGKAFVSLRPGKQASVEDIMQFLKGKIANFKIPKSVEFLEAIPRSAAGKVLKNELRKKYWSG